jgi:hypothetical protein
LFKRSFLFFLKDLTASAAKTTSTTVRDISARTAASALTESTPTPASARSSGPASTAPRTWTNVPAATTPARMVPRVPMRKAATPASVSMAMRATTVRKM